MDQGPTYLAVDENGKTLTDACSHLADIGSPVPATPGQCEDCLVEGTAWVHLRLCLQCGHVGCCDSSPRRHATAHWDASGHPIVASAEPGENWAWCYPDEVILVPTGE